MSDFENVCEGCGEEMDGVHIYVNRSGEEQEYCFDCYKYQTIMRHKFDRMNNIVKGGKDTKTYKELMDDVEKETRKQLEALREKQIKLASSRK